MRLVSTLTMLFLAGCGDRRDQDHDAPVAQQNSASKGSDVDPSFSARLTRGDPTLCSDPDVHNRVVVQTLEEFDRDAAEKYHLLRSHGGSLEFVGARMKGTQPKIAEISCSATLPKGFSGKPFSFTYALRPLGSSGEILVDHKGDTNPWFHFRGTILSKLAEMGLFEARKPAIPQVQPATRPGLNEPNYEPPPGEDIEPLPMNEDIPVPADEDPPAG